MKPVNKTVMTALAAAFLAAACGGGSTEPDCRQGEARACKCRCGGNGEQRCIDNGDKTYSWGKCEGCIPCPDEDGGINTDGGNPDAGPACPASPTSVVGSVCNSDADCAGLQGAICLNNVYCALIAQYFPSCDIPDGYCTVYTANLQENLKCGAGATAIDFSTIDPRAKMKGCVKCCQSDADCRTGTGYWCWKWSGYEACVPAFVKGLLP